MNITFEGPRFFAPEDEDQFFGWLRSLPEHRQIVGSGRELELELATPVSATTVRQLLVLFRRWCLDPTALLPLRSAETESHVLWATPLSEASREA
jgi:hypothetical protein